MPLAQFPLSGARKLRPRSGRKPLRPRNISADLDSVQAKAKKPVWTEISQVADSNKENHPAYTTTPVKMESFDASLAEELSAVRKRRERLKIDEERMEKMLQERDLKMETWMKEVKHRGQDQKKLEMEVDRLFRLKELRSVVRISPIRSLREKEREKRSDAPQLPASPFRRRSVLFLKASMEGSTSPGPNLGLDRSKTTWSSPSPSRSPSLGLNGSKSTLPSPSPSPSPRCGLDRSGSTIPSSSSPSLSLDGSKRTLRSPSPTLSPRCGLHRSGSTIPSSRSPSLGLDESKSALLSPSSSPSPGCGVDSSEVGKEK